MADDVAQSLAERHLARIEAAPRGHDVAQRRRAPRTEHLLDCGWRVMFGRQRHSIPGVNVIDMMIQTIENLGPALRIREAFEKAPSSWWPNWETSRGSTLRAS